MLLLLVGVDVSVVAVWCNVVGCVVSDVVLAVVGCNWVVSDDVASVVGAVIDVVLGSGVDVINNVVGRTVAVVVVGCWLK